MRFARHPPIEGVLGASTRTTLHLDSLAAVPLVSRLDRRALLRATMSFALSGVCLPGVSSACTLLPQTPTKMPRIGFLAPGPREGFGSRLDGLLQGLQDLGYFPDESITVESRFASEGASDAELASLATELVRLPVDVFVTYGLAQISARQATSTIPIVALNSAFYVEGGLVSSLARPGGNVTGLSASAPGESAKRLELLRDVVPGLAPRGCVRPRATRSS